MNREAIIERLRAHEAELKAAGILHLHLHGSVVRGEARADSDVDLAAVYDRGKVKSPLTEIRLARELSTLLGAEVDLANERTLKEAIRPHFDREAILVF